MDSELQDLFLLPLVRRIILDGLENLCQLVSEEDGDDCGRRFVRAEPVVIAGCRHGQAQKILVVIHRLDYGAQKQEELRIFIGGLSRRKQVCPVIRGHRPVVVLAGSVDAGKRLLVKQADHAVLSRNFLHDLHRQLVRIRCDVCGGIDRRQLVLGRGHLVVLGLH